MKEHFFSIIMPVYNRANFLEKSIGSVLSQTYTHFELIVVDDGSTDHTAEVVQGFKVKYPDKQIHYLYKENGERGAARNYGVLHAKGELLTFLDSDDILLPHCLEKANDFYTHNAQYEWFHLVYDTRDQNDDLLIGPRQWKEPIKFNLIKGNPLSCITVFIKTATALHNPFDENRQLSGLEDWELWLRMAAQYELGLVLEVCATLQAHDSRSVLQKNPTQLLARVELFISKVSQNPNVRKFIGNNYKLFLASVYSYLSLHLSLMKNEKRTTLIWLGKSIFVSPRFVFERRFYAILKHLF